MAANKGNRSWWSSEKAREMANAQWAQLNTPEARRLKTLKMRIACGQKAQKELDTLLKAATEAAREASS